MQAESFSQDRIVSIEIYIDPIGVSPQELDERTRQLASELRQLPHKSVGIINDQVPSADRSNEVATQGAVAMTLDPEYLSKVLELLRTGSLRQERRGIKLKGPGAIELDLANPDLDEAADAWLNAVSKQPQIASSS